MRPPAAVHADLKALIDRFGDQSAPWSPFKDAQQIGVLVRELEYSLFRRPNGDGGGITADLNAWRDVHASGAFHHVSRGEPLRPVAAPEKAAPKAEPSPATKPLDAAKPSVKKTAPKPAAKAAAKPAPKTAKPTSKNAAKRAKLQGNRGMRSIAAADPSMELESEYRGLLAEARSLRARAKALTLSTEVRKLDEQRTATRRRIEAFRIRWMQRPYLAAAAREKAAVLERVVEEARWRRPKKGHGGWVTSAGLPSLSRRG